MKSDANFILMCVGTMSAFYLVQNLSSFFFRKIVAGVRTRKERADAKKSPVDLASLPIETLKNLRNEIVKEEYKTTFTKMDRLFSSWPFTHHSFFAVISGLLVSTVWVAGVCLLGGWVGSEGAREIIPAWFYKDENTLGFSVVSSLFFFGIGGVGTISTVVGLINSSMSRFVDAAKERRKDHEKSQKAIAEVERHQKLQRVSEAITYIKDSEKTFSVESEEPKREETRSLEELLDAIGIG